MNEHDDDLEAEVEEDAEFETAEFTALVEEDEATDVPGEQATAETEGDIDPDKSEI
jgi:hypothetical protein